MCEEGVPKTRQVRLIKSLVNKCIPRESGDDPIPLRIPGPS